MVNVYLNILSRLANVEHATMNLMNLNLKLSEELPKKVIEIITENYEKFSQKVEFHDFENKIRFDAQRHAIDKKIYELKHDHRLEHLNTVSQELSKEFKNFSSRIENEEKERNNIEEKLIKIDKYVHEKLDRRMEMLTKKLEIQYSKMNTKLQRIDEQLEIFTKYLEENSSGLKLICTRFDQSTLLDASLDIKLDSSLMCIRALSSEMEKLKSSIAGYNEMGHNKKGCYSNWERKHDNLLEHNFLPCHDLLTSLGEFLMKEDEPNALGDLENNLSALKYKCVKVNSETRFPNDGALHADLNDTPMSITFTNFLEAVKSQSMNIGKPFVSLMIKTLTEPNMVKYGIYDCKTFEQKYGLRWTV